MKKNKKTKAGWIIAIPIGIILGTLLGQYFIGIIDDVGIEGFIEKLKGLVAPLLALICILAAILFCWRIVNRH